MPRPSASAWTTPPGIARLRTRTFLHGGCGAPHARHSRQGAISERAAFGRTPRARQYRRGPPAAATRDWHTQTHSTGLPGRLRPTLLRTSSRGLCPSRLHRRLLDEEPRGGAEIAERDVFGFDLENLLPLPASATSASPRCNLVSLFKITFARHSNGLPGVPSRSRRRRLDGCAPPRSVIGHRM